MASKNRRLPSKPAVNVGNLDFTTIKKASDTTSSKVRKGEVDLFGNGESHTFYYRSVSAKQMQEYLELKSSAEQLQGSISFCAMLLCDETGNDIITEEQLAEMDVNIVQKLMEALVDARGNE